MKENNDTIIGTTANGVSYLVVPPRGDAASVPVVIAWHLLDPPRTEAAFRAAISLDGLDAWKVYLGLPMSGSRTPAGGQDEMMAKLGTDAPGLVHGPIHSAAADEFPAALEDLRSRFGFGADATVALVGGSMGAAVAAEIIARGTSGAAAAVLLSPLLQLRPMIDAVAPQFGGYEWTPEGAEAAERLDYLARAGELSGVPIRIVVGADDLQAIVQSAREVAEATGADLHVIDGMAHALAEEPGLEPAAQTEQAREADALAVEWLAAHL